MDTTTVTLAGGRKIEIREPYASELVGVPLLSIMQMDTQVWATLMERISDIGKADFLRLPAKSATKLMVAALPFVIDTDDEEVAEALKDAQSPETSKTPTS